MKKCLIVFAKEPKGDHVKTRLAESIGKKSALELYKALIQDTLNIAREVKADGKFLAHDALYYEEPEYLQGIARDFVFFRQKGSDLGEKMHNAFEFAKSVGADKTVIIGSDSPTLKVANIDEAFLRLDEVDVVIGPACDGGYYLIGLKEPSSALMNGIKWSASSVSEDTIRNADGAGLKVGLLALGLDVDVVHDLSSLKEIIERQKEEVTPYTREFIGSIKL